MKSNSVTSLTESKKRFMKQYETVSIIFFKSSKRVQHIDSKNFLRKIAKCELGGRICNCDRITSI